MLIKFVNIFLRAFFTILQLLKSFLKTILNYVLNFIKIFLKNNIKFHPKSSEISLITKKFSLILHSFLKFILATAINSLKQLKKYAFIFAEINHLIGIIEFSNLNSFTKLII